MSFVADRVDAALEWSVVGSFTRLGSALRRRLNHWAPLDGGRVAGRVMVMTGATSGLGLEAARILAGLGASIEVIARDARKAEATCAGLREATGNPKVAFVVADTGDLVAVRRAAAELLHRHPAIHVLIHNAGALDDVRQESPQGIELTVASQVVGPFLLTGLLLPALRAGAPARVLWVSSGGMYSEPLSVNRLEMSAGGYEGTIAYARAKRPQVTLAELWAERLAGDGSSCIRCTPGGPISGPGAVAPDVSARRRTAVAKPGGGGRHAGLAGRRRGSAAGTERAVLARSPSTAAAPPGVDPALRHSRGA